MHYFEIDFDKYEDIQNVDMAIRNVQTALDNLKKYDDCNDILEYNKSLEPMRSLIHKKLKHLNES